MSVAVVKFEFTGLFGLAGALTSGEEEYATRFSIFDLITLMRHHAKIIGTARAGFGLFILSTLVLFSTMIVGMGLIGTLGCIWFAPMKDERKKRLRSIVEILEAWNYMDVFIASVFMIISQIGEMAGNLASDICGGEQLFAALGHFGVLSERHARCYNVVPSFQSGVFILMLYSCMLKLLSNTVVSALAQYMDDVNLLSKNEKALNAINMNLNDGNRKKSIHDYNASDDESYVDVSKKMFAKEVRFTDKFMWLLTVSRVGLEK